jgi:hypothetical protein
MRKRNRRRKEGSELENIMDTTLIKLEIRIITINTKR